MKPEEFKQRFDKLTPSAQKIIKRKIKTLKAKQDRKDRKDAC